MTRLISILSCQRATLVAGTLGERIGFSTGWLLFFFSFSSFLDLESLLGVKQRQNRHRHRARLHVSALAAVSDRRIVSTCFLADPPCQYTLSNDWSSDTKARLGIRRQDHQRNICKWVHSDIIVDIFDFSWPIGVMPFLRIGFPPLVSLRGATHAIGAAVGHRKYHACFHLPLGKSHFHYSSIVTQYDWSYPCDIHRGPIVASNLDTDTPSSG